jgi:hypothetical protein
MFLFSCAKQLNIPYFPSDFFLFSTLLYELDFVFDTLYELYLYAI